MKNITLAVDDELVTEGRRYARKHHTSLNGLVRDLLAKNVRPQNVYWADECIRKMDAAGGHSGGRQWRRKDLYDV